MPVDPFKGRKPGSIPANRIAVIDRHGNVRGHVGRTATQATVARFIGHPNAELGKVKGRPAWIERLPSQVKEAT